MLLGYSAEKHRTSLESIYETTFFFLLWEAEMEACVLHAKPASAYSHGLVSFPKWLKPFEVNPSASITTRGFIFDSAYSFFVSQHPHFIPFGLGVLKSLSASSK